MTTASLAVLVSTNAPLVQSLRAKSILLTLTFVLTAALALMFALLVLSLRANNRRFNRQLNSTGCLISVCKSRLGQLFLCAFIKEKRALGSNVA